MHSLDKFIEESENGRHKVLMFPINGSVNIDFNLYKFDNNNHLLRLNKW